MNIIVTAAGAGKRFTDKGYYVPKPFIRIGEYYAPTIIEKTLSSLQDTIKQSNSVTFAFGDYYNDWNIQSQFDEINKRWQFPNCKVSVFPQLTRGNLETAYITALQTRPDPEKPLLILDSDNYFGGQNFGEVVNDINIQRSIISKCNEYGLTCCFRPLDTSTKWGFVIPYHEPVDSKVYMVKKLLEKDPKALEIGGLPMVGVFYFSKAKLFLNAAKEILYNTQQTGEFYMTQSLQHLLNAKIDVFALEVGNVIPLGTPEDLQAYMTRFISKYNI